MQTNLADFIKHTREGEQADAILRSCVHCGFCAATCPTYQLLGDELDSPRGRIYLIKQVLEGKQATAHTQNHLDRCLTCRNCESTCPSGVQYGRLLDIGRKIVDERVVRPVAQRLARLVLKEILPRKWLFTPLLKIGQLARPIIPAPLRAKIPRRQTAGARPAATQVRKMLLLEGCVQPGLAPNINAAAARVFDAVGVQLLTAPKAGCCGAIRHHLGDREAALDDMRRNIDAWWPLLEAGAEAIAMTASGCGAIVKEYGHLLAHDTAYAAKAKRVAELCKDLSELVPQFESRLSGMLKRSIGERVVFHPPCTLQHGQQIRGKVESVLRAVGIDAQLCEDSHLCCGSAGAYSLLQPEIAMRLRDDKLTKLHATGATVIASANIGCLTHLQSGTEVPVKHWIELIDAVIAV